MTYDTPALLLVGSASQLVLGVNLVEDGHIFDNPEETCSREHVGPTNC
jgi:hypothetical protein